MQKHTIIITFLLLCRVVPQSSIQLIDSVPEQFKQRYIGSEHDYNPLHVGDVWQYYFEETNRYVATRIVKDSVINGKKYYKKINWRHEYNPNGGNCISWERNDSLTGISYMLDFQDVDNDGNTLEELLLDSLEIPNYSSYLTYKYSYIPPGTGLFAGPKTAYVKDSGWAVIWGDTVLYRTVEYIELFLIENIADQFGVALFWNESPSRYLVGAIIDGKKYGYVVGINDKNFRPPSSTTLAQNYPNPFNPLTTIRFDLPQASDVQLVLYNVLGQEVATLIDKPFAAGRHNFILDASGYAAGIYFYKIKTDQYQQARKMLLIK